MRNSTPTTVLTVFCDNTRDEREWQASAWGQMEARDHYREMLEKANDNSFLGRQMPHIISVCISTGESQAVETFHCECTPRRSA